MKDSLIFIQAIITDLRNHLQDDTIMEEETLEELALHLVNLEILKGFMEKDGK